MCNIYMCIQMDVRVYSIRVIRMHKKRAVERKNSAQKKRKGKEKKSHGGTGRTRFYRG